MLLHTQVGWWDPEIGGWNTTGITDVLLDPTSSSLSFHTTHTGPLAVIQSRAALLPYTTWNVRPTGGRNGNTAALTISCTALPEPLVFDVS